jgi:hypothetical protein
MRLTASTNRREVNATHAQKYAYRDGLERVKFAFVTGV